MRRKLELALDLLGHGNWQRFEQFASGFLTPEHPALRTVATSSGDRGRDAELFRSDAAPSVVFQYSVAADWRAKVRATASRVKDSFPEVVVLVYMTNQLIGAEADELKHELQQELGLFLDVRDRNWFADRADDPPRQAAVGALLEDILDPYLASRGVIEGKAQALTTIEARAALLYLTFQWEDANREKGLTKLSFEALVLTALRETDSENRLTRDAVRRRVRALLPAHPETQVDHYTDSALGRLAKSRIRHWRQDDEFCLSYAERIHQAARLLDLSADDLELTRELSQTVEHHCGNVGSRCPDPDAMVSRIRRIIERFLLVRGEAFAASLSRGTYELVPLDVLREAVVAEIGDAGPLPVDGDGVTVAMAVAEDVLARPSERVQRYLRSLSDAYTLFAFLRETPDVQSAVTKMFSHGEIWLDTTVVLPLFVEELVEPPFRQYTNMLMTARESGLKFRVTPGVLEEIERNMNQAETYARRQFAEPWRGHLPFLFVNYALAGRSRDGFSGWLERFRGRFRPEADIAEYIEREWGIEVQGLQEHADRAPVELRGAVQEVWHQVHEQRRSGERSVDSLTTLRLVDHDVENYLGVVMRRTRERDSPFGYTSWWMTLDSRAHRVRSEIAKSVKTQPPDSPIISPDFMVNYLALGPLRARVPKSVEAALPLITEVSSAEFPAELIELADELRAEQADLDEHVVRRNVRDRLDAARRRAGELAQRGFRGMEDELQRALRAEAPADPVSPSSG